MRKSDALAVVALIQAAYPRHPWPEPTVGLFASELERFDRAPTEQAVRAILRVRTNEFPPSVGELLSGLVREGGELPSFGEAWAEMSSKASVGDPVTPPSFSHVVVDELARQIRWERFRMSSRDDTYFEYAARQRYDEICERELHDISLGLPTLADRAEMRRLAEGKGVGELVQGIGTDPDA